MSITWRFGKDDGGLEAGFHDPGVETFRGDFNRYLARELIQNSLDAREDPNKPVRVCFSLEQIKRELFPDIDTLCATFECCGEYWSSQPKVVSYFRRASELASAKELTCLRISDCNTTGVRGSDSDRDRSWYNLVRSSGSTDKSGGQGGSFGIGKNAPFAASPLRTVFYSTRYDGDQNVFQGVAKLVTHQATGGGKCLPVGYLGMAGTSVRESADIPEIFRRSEQGADILILGFHAPDSKWQDDLLHSVLTNFWPAIHFGHLEATIGKHSVTADTLEEMLDLFAEDEGFNAHLFHQAFSNPTKMETKTLRNLKECSTYLLASDNEEMPKLVAMIRQTGMVVFPKRFNSLIPFCGVFICRNDAGNAILREMEPPKHDEWNPDLPEPAASKKYEREYVKFIREVIASLAPIDDSDHIEIEDLNRFLPDDGSDPEKPFEHDGNNTLDEPAMQPADFTIIPRTSSPAKIATNPLSEETSDDPQGTDDNLPDQEPNNDPGDPPINRPSPTRPSPSPENPTNSPEPRGVSIPIGFRTFCVNAAAGRYRVAVTAINSDAELVLSLIVVGDDQRSLAAAASARLAHGATVVDITPLGRIGPVSCLLGQRVILDVLLREPGRYSLEVSAHEAV